MIDFMPLILFALVCIFLLFGFPVAFTLAGVSIIFALITSFFGVFDLFLLETLPNRIFGVMTNSTLIAVPLFIFMGVLLEKSKVAEELLLKMSDFFSGFRGGLGLSVIFVGALLAASTGIVGATVIAMGLISLPAFFKTRISSRSFYGLNFCYRYFGTNHPSFYCLGNLRRCVVFGLSTVAT